MNDSIVVVPTYNERNNLSKLVSMILEQKPGFDILVVDDNSPDGTGQLADELAAEYSQVHVLHRPHKKGLGFAYVAGFQRVLAMGYDFILQMDADHSHDPNQLPELRAAAGYNDVVLGSRYLGGIRVLDWELSRLLISVFGNWYARTITGMQLSDLTGGFKCYRREALETINLEHIHSVGYAFQIEMTWWAHQRKLRIGEVPIIFYGREHDESKFSRSIIWEAAWTVWKLRLGLVRNEAPVAASSAAFL